MRGEIRRCLPLTPILNTRSLTALTGVKDIMSTELAVIHTEDPLDYATNYMRQRNIGRLPVVEDKNPKKLIGIITTSDIVAAYMDSQNSFKPRKDTSA